MVTKVNKTQTTMGESDWSLLDFIDLPGDYTGQQGKVLVVNATEDGMVFAEGGSGGASSFPGLADTPEDYTTASPGDMVVVNPTGNGLIFETPPPTPPTPVTNVVDLDDVQDSMVGQALKVVRVNAAENQLEFVELPALSSIGDLGDVQELTGSIQEYILRVNAAGDGVEYVDRLTAIPNNTYTFDGLSDTPAIVAGQFLRGAAGGGLEFAPLGEINTFAGLADTPTTGELSAAPGYLLVAGDGGGVALVPPVTARDNFTDLLDTPVTLSGQADKVVTVNAAGNGLEFRASNHPPLVLQVGGDTDEITVGTGKLHMRMPAQMSLADVRCSVTTAPSGGPLTVSVRTNGNLITQSALVVANGQEISPKDATLDDSYATLLAGDEVTVDVDGITGTPQGLKVYLVPA